MNKREANKLQHGDRVTYMGPVDGRHPDVEPYIGCGGRVVTGPGGYAVDSDGDLRIVWDDHAFNDQTYPPDNDGSWLYCPAKCLSRETELNITNINDIEQFLKEG